MRRFIRGYSGGPSSAQNDTQGARRAEAPRGQDDKKLHENPKSDIAPNAPVWRKYVDETDRYDADIVEGWDNSLDVLLIFAALFSAISAAFVVQSTQDLKPDYAESSAQTLTAILQALSAGSSTNASNISNNDQPEFSPSSTAITVNILWFMSLSLSVAVALIAIVAKDWCYQFMSGRTGQFILQGRRRQLRWEGIEKWKMQGILNVLPLMMHAALLLFAVGLSIYLWDINPWVALPVVVTTILVGLFYIVTLFLPLFFRYCPFTTGFIKMLLPSWYKIAGTVLEPVLQVFGWLLVPLLATRAIVKYCARRGLGNPHNSELESSKLSLHRWIIQVPFRSFWTDSRQSINDRIQSILHTVTSDRSRLDNQDTPMDDVTSSMLGWMIARCEDPSAVDIALKALVCARPWLPRDPLVRCRAFEVAVIRLSTSMTAWRNTFGGSEEERKRAQDVILQSQCLSVMSHMDVVDLPEKYLEITNSPWIILNLSWNQDKDYRLASKELGSLSLHLGNHWARFNRWREQVDRQWGLVRMVVSKNTAGLCPADICHLVDGISKSYLYEPDQPPGPLVDLLAMSEYADNHPLRRMIGIALTTACFANCNYPGCSAISDWPTRQKRARAVYIKLSTTPAVRDRWEDIDQLLTFGLLGVFFTESRSDWSVDCTQVMGLMIGIGTYQLTCDDLLSLGLPQNPLTTALKWLLESAPTSANISSPLSESLSSKNTSEVTIEMAVINSGLQAKRLEWDVCRTGMIRLQDPAYLEHAVQLLRLIRKEATSVMRRVRDHSRYYSLDKKVMEAIVESNLYHRTRPAIDSGTNDITPHCMSFIWTFTRCLLTLWHHPDIRDKPNLLPIIEPFRPEGDLSEDVVNMGFAESWIGKLEEACEQNPQNVLDSEVLNEMIDYYREGGHHQDFRPSAEGGTDTEPPRTWLQILTDLRRKCEDMRIEASASLDGVSERHSDPGVEETRMDDGKEAHDESLSERNAEEGMKLDQLPPEILECVSFYWTDKEDESNQG